MVLPLYIFKQRIKIVLAIEILCIVLVSVIDLYYSKLQSDQMAENNNAKLSNLTDNAKNYIDTYSFYDLLESNLTKSEIISIKHYQHINHDYNRSDVNFLYVLYLAEFIFICTILIGKSKSLGIGVIYLIVISAKIIYLVFLLIGHFNMMHLLSISFILISVVICSCLLANGFDASDNFPECSLECKYYTAGTNVSCIQCKSQIEDLVHYQCSTKNCKFITHDKCRKDLKQCPDCKGTFIVTNV